MALLENIREDIEGDEQAVHDAIEGETGMIEAVTKALCRINELAALEDATKAQAKALTERANRFAATAERIRASICLAMGDTGLKKLETPVGTISRRPVAVKVLITDEEALPSAYLIEKTTISVDRKALLSDLKEGVKVTGAELSNGGETISVRV
jgi:hypothetical protein